jgi:hypothetical protein
MKKPVLRRTAIGLLWFYGIQFAFGMTMNLFVTLPDKHPGTTGGEYFSRSFESLVWALSFGGGVMLFLHALLGLILFLGALSLFVNSLRLSARGWRWPSGIALFFTFGAFFNGMSFLDYNEDFSSAIMAGCWLIAVSAVIVPLIRTRIPAEAIEAL